MLVVAELPCRVLPVRAVTRGRLRQYACHWLIALSVLVATLAPASAFSDCQGALISLPLDKVEQASSITLRKLRSLDVFGSPAEQQDFHDSGASRRHEQFRRPVTRAIERLWRIKVARSVSPSSLIVRYRLIGNDDATIGHSEAKDARLKVVLIARRPKVVCRNSSHQIMEGSADLTISVGQLSLAGRYIGTIETEVRVR